MARLAADMNVPIVYVSAGSVFDGTKNSPYTPDDVPNPINHYNTSKWYGELICRMYEKHYIVRAGWMFGGGAQVDKKFVHKIIEKIKRGETDIRVADDCIGSPTYNIDFAKAIENILNTGIYGIYHAPNKSNGVSRYEFAQEIVNIMGLKNKVNILPCKIDDLKEEFPCKRTNYEVIEPSVETRDWKEALKGYLYANY
jgi:dTDP-4-dehydrorhamnose reductase